MPLSDVLWAIRYLTSQSFQILRHLWAIIGNAIALSQNVLTNLCHCTLSGCANPRFLLLPQEGRSRPAETTSGTHVAIALAGYRR